MPFRLVSSLLLSLLTIVNKESLLTIVNEGLLLTIVNVTTVFLKQFPLKNDPFKKTTISFFVYWLSFSNPKERLKKNKNDPSLITITIGTENFYNYGELENKH